MQRIFGGRSIFQNMKSTQRETIKGMVVKSWQTTDFTQHARSTTQGRKPTEVDRLAWVTWLAGGRGRENLTSISWISAFKAPTLEHSQLPSLHLSLLPGIPNIIGRTEWQEPTTSRAKENEADPQSRRSWRPATPTAQTVMRSTGVPGK